MKTKHFLIAAVLFASCTANQRAKRYGGKETYDLKPNEILVNATWKDDNMWVLTKDTLTKKMYFREKSSWGVWQGEIEFQSPSK